MWNNSNLTNKGENSDICSNINTKLVKFHILYLFLLIILTRSMFNDTYERPSGLEVSSLLKIYYEIYISGTYSTIKKALMSWVQKSGETKSIFLSSSKIFVVFCIIAIFECLNEAGKWFYVPKIFRQYTGLNFNDIW